MADEKKGTYVVKAGTIKKQTAEINDAYKGLSEAKNDLIAKCLHVNEDGRTALSRTNHTSPVSGKPLFRCDYCGEELDIQRFSPEEIQKAAQVVITMNNLFKISMASSKNPKDAKLLKSVIRNQKYMMTKFKRLCEVTQKRNGNKKHGNGSGNTNFVVGQPVSNRR